MKKPVSFTLGLPSPPTRATKWFFPIVNWNVCGAVLCYVVQRLGPCSEQNDLPTLVSPTCLVRHLSLLDRCSFVGQKLLC